METLWNDRSKDPEIDPKFHEDAKDDEYAYSDRDSRLYSTNLETAKTGQALPFKNVDEFKDYVIKKMNLNLMTMLAGSSKSSGSSISHSTLASQPALSINLGFIFLMT